MFKKVLFGLGSAILLGAGSVALVNAQNTSTFTPGTFNANTTDINVGGSASDQGGNLIQVIKNFINWVLGILSLIVLIICLYGGFLMVTAAGDDGKYKKGFTILKQAGIGLVIIGLSRFIVSIIFRIIGGVQTGTTN